MASNRHKIGLWIGNLMDRIKVQNSLNNAGYEIETIPDLSACQEFLGANSNNIVVVDLTDSSVKFEQFKDQPLELMKRIVGYFPHVQIQLKKEAETYGIKHIFPRSMFFSDTASLIQRIIDAK